MDFSTELLVMAVVNRTPDSFFDRGSTFDLDRAISAALHAVDSGADWVDIGGVPFAPGAPLPPAEETERVLPVIQALHAQHPSVIISVDTFHACVADSALAAGATVVNDTTGISDPEMVDVICDHNGHVVITHSQTTQPGRARTTVPRPQYGDVVTEVKKFLQERVDYAQDQGIPGEKILIDPGHDLNKNTLHSLELTRRFSEIAELGYPTLAAVSNKDFVGESLGAPKNERTEGSLAAAVTCALAGARVFRMHDARVARRALDMTAAIMGIKEPVELAHNMGQFNV